MDKKKTNERGITLISLVITIILLLILATVAISLAVDSDGLFSKAGTASNNWNSSVIKEKEKIENLIVQLDNLESIDTSKLENKLDEYSNILEQDYRYTETTYNEFYNQYQDANKLLKKEKITQIELTEMTQKIDEKYGELNERTEPVITCELYSTSDEELKAIVHIDGNFSDIYKIQHAGILYIKTAKLTSEELTIDTTGRSDIHLSTLENNLNGFITPITSSLSYTVRAYAYCINLDNELVYVYSDMVVGSLSSVPQEET